MKKTDHEEIKNQTQDQILPTMADKRADAVDEIYDGPNPDQTLILDGGLKITLPLHSVEGEKYLAVEEYREAGKAMSLGTGPESRIPFEYVTSIGTVHPADNITGDELYQAFIVYRARTDLDGKKLADWIAAMQRWNFPEGDFPVEARDEVDSTNESLRADDGSEIVYFHMPVPSDNGWYAYKNGGVVYLFSFGSSSDVVSGWKSGLWERVIRSMSLSIKPERSSDFTSRLDSGRLEKIFSVPKSAEILSWCPECAENGIDPIEGQYWDFQVSSDYAKYAYIEYKDGRSFVVLNGEPQKGYDRVHHLRFSPDGKMFTYHAYDKVENITYLIVNDREISVYPGDEGWPHAANGVSEAFSTDGQFAYVKATSFGDMEIYLNDRLINKVKGSLVHPWFTEDNQHLRYVVLSANSNGGDSYYEDDHLLDGDAEYEDSIDFGNKVSLGDWEIMIDHARKKVFAGQRELADYMDRTPEVYLSSITTNKSADNAAYVVWENGWGSMRWVSLNGNDTKQRFNNIRDLRFSDDGKSLVYTARKGRDVYRVTYEILPKQR